MDDVEMVHSDVADSLLHRAQRAEYKVEDLRKRFQSAQAMLRDIRDQLGLTWKLRWVEVIEEAGKIKSRLDAAEAELRERDEVLRVIDARLDVILAKLAEANNVVEAREKYLKGALEGAVLALEGIATGDVHGVPGQLLSGVKIFAANRALVARVALEATAQPAGAPSGVDWIAQERRRQIEIEGWTAEHDDEHDAGELGEAAAYYCDYCKPEWARDFLFPANWDDRWMKRQGFPFPTLRDLIKAGALVAAEIDRRQRKMFGGGSDPATEADGQ